MQTGSKPGSCTLGLSELKANKLVRIQGMRTHPLYDVRPFSPTGQQVETPLGLWTLASSGARHNHYLGPIRLSQAPALGGWLVIL